MSRPNPIPPPTSAPAGSDDTDAQLQAAIKESKKAMNEVMEAAVDAVAKAAAEAARHDLIDATTQDVAVAGTPGGTPPSPQSTLDQIALAVQSTSDANAAKTGAVNADR